MSRSTWTSPYCRKVEEDKAWLDAYQQEDQKVHVNQEFCRLLKEQKDPEAHQ